MLTHKFAIVVGLVIIIALVACQPTGFTPLSVPAASPMPASVSAPTLMPTVTPALLPTPSPTTLVGSGIRGTVMLNPTCPGPQRIGQVCTKPYAADLIITRSDGTEAARVTSSEIDGTFSVDLPAGDYTIAPLKDVQKSPPVPRLTTVDVLVKAGAYTQVDLQFDTGMR